VAPAGRFKRLNPLVKMFQSMRKISLEGAELQLKLKNGLIWLPFRILNPGSRQRPGLGS
jgi:hypothetical protein